MPVKKYWQSLEGRENLRIDTGGNPGDSHQNAVIDLLDSKTVDQPASRRDFLKLWGFSIGAAVLAASCKRPVQKAIPSLSGRKKLHPGWPSILPPPTLMAKNMQASW